MKKFKFVYCDPFKCVGCGICEYACSLKHENALSAATSRIRTVRIYPHRNVAITCVLCEDPPCVKACPRDALEQNEEGVITVKEEKCVGCGLCVESCDFGAITLHPKGRIPIVCDLCDGSLLCVEVCPEDALDLTTKDIQAQLKRVKAAKSLTGAINP
ncbi:TPA: 4Fe-4S dicluster domain-containing protein [Candidatus Bathyarchaeota archaeon]|nr:4Fe-4S dicluster domain-containing protein [Candidatus Bathyarchaeota archaeon]